MTTLLLIDGNAIMHRAYFALPPMRTSDGTPTNAVRGFFMMLHRAMTDFKPDYAVVCFDTPKPTFRRELLAEYQAHRPKSDDAFIQQIPLIRDLLEASGIKRMERDGYEADDMIGTLTVTFKKQVDRVLILTGDKDIMQLVDTNVFVMAPKTGLSSITLYTIDEVIKKMGVRPEQIPDLKALAGDPSDNYKGVKGIGPKTAAELVVRFGSVESMIEHVDEIEKEKLRNTIKEHTKIVALMKKIATIVTDLDVEGPLEHFAFTGYNPAMRPLMEGLELNTLIRQYFDTPFVAPKKQAAPAVEKKKKPEEEPQQGLF